MAWCLLKEQADKFIEGLKSGEIDPRKLADMTSEERHGFLADFVGEANAKNVNALFESKLLLKNQQRGMVTWAKRVAGLKPEARRDLISRIERLDRVLNPEEEQAFLHDLAATKLGVDVTYEEAARLTAMSKSVTEGRAIVDSGGDPEKFARAKVALENYIDDLKNPANKMGLIEQLRNIDIKDKLKHPEPVKALKAIGGVAKSMKAAWDDSWLGRQGHRLFFVNNKAWRKVATQSFKDIADTFGGKAVMDEIKVQVYSNPQYLNGRATKAKLAVGVVEEAYPTSLPRKLPLGAGKVFEASEVAFVGAQYRSRLIAFEQLIKIGEKAGQNVDDAQWLEGAGRLVNSLTARGSLGKYEHAGELVNNVMFSGRNLKGNIDFLTMHLGDRNMSPWLKKRAAINLAKVVTGDAAILVLADVIRPGSVEWDSRSADFGKIRVGSTRFDVTGGMSSFIILASRLAQHSIKSSTTGKITQISAGNWGKSGTDLFIDFFKNKLSPISRAGVDIADQEDFKGNKPTVAGEAVNLFAPIAVTNYQELANDPYSANTLAAVILDGLGLGTNTYDYPGAPDISYYPHQARLAAAERKLAANDKIPENRKRALIKYIRDTRNKLTKNAEGR